MATTVESLDYRHTNMEECKFLACGWPSIQPQSHATVELINAETTEEKVRRNFHWLSCLSGYPISKIATVIKTNHGNCLFNWPSLIERTHTKGSYYLLHTARDTTERPEEAASRLCTNQARLNILTVQIGRSIHQRATSKGMALAKAASTRERELW